jgi:hypothetical protein
MATIHELKDDIEMLAEELIGRVCAEEDTDNIINTFKVLEQRVNEAVSILKSWEEQI